MSWVDEVLLALVIWANAIANPFLLHLDWLKDLVIPWGDKTDGVLEESISSVEEEVGNLYELPHGWDLTEALIWRSITLSDKLKMQRIKHSWIVYAKARKDIEKIEQLKILG